MTPDKTPTDEELKAMLPTKQLARDESAKVQVWLTQSDALAFARAVLARWGAPVVAGEPIGYTHSSWLAEAKRGRNGVFVANQMIGFDRPLYTTPQPTHPQAGAVPLTREQVKAILTECGYDGASAQHRADFITGLRHGEAAHGIKEGGQHATD